MQKSYQPLHSFNQDELSRKNTALYVKIAHRNNTIEIVSGIAIFHLV